MMSFKLACRSFFQHKRVGILLIVVLSLSIILLITANTATQGILNQMEEKAYNKYGEFHAIVHQVDDQKLESIKKLKEIDKIGEVLLFGTARLRDNESPVTVGYINEEAWQLGRLSLKSGRLPQTENEIVIQSFLTEGNPELKVNSKVTLTVKGKQQVVMIVGILENYSYQWYYPENIEVGKNDYPHLLVTSDFGEKISKGEIYRSLWLTSTYSFLPGDNVKLSNLLFSKGIDNLGNYNLVQNGLTTYALFKKYCLYFSIVLWLGTGVCSAQIFQLFYRTFRRKIGILMSYGATRVHIYRVLILQMCLALCCSLSFSLPIIALIQYVCLKQTYFEISVDTFFTLENLVLAMTWLTILFVSMLFISWQFIQKASRKSVMVNLRNTAVQTIPHEFYRRFAFLPFSIRYFFIQLLARWQSSIQIIWIFSVVIFILFYTHILSEQMKLDFASDDYYELISADVTSNEIVNNFEVQSNHEAYFPHAVRDQLQSLSGVKVVEETPYQQGTTLFMDKEQISSGWENWYKTYRQKNSYVNISKEDIAQLQLSSTKKAMPMVRFYVLNDEACTELQKAYGLNTEMIQKFKESPAVFIFLSERFQVHKNDLEMKRTELSRIERNQDTNQLQLRSWTVDVIQTIPKSFELTVAGEKRSYSLGISVVLYEKQARGMNLFKGYTILRPYMDSNATQEEIEKVENVLIHANTNLSGSRMKSSIENKEKSEEISLYISFLGKVLFGVVLLFGVLVTGLSMYIRLMERRGEIALNYANGMQIKSIMKTFIYEIVLYLGLAIFFSGLVSTEIIKRFSMAEPDVYTPYYFISVIFVVLSSFVSLLIPYHHLTHTPLTGILRREE